MSQLGNKNNPSTEDMELMFSQARKASDLLKALSHETRLVILCLLMEGEKSVSEIENIVLLPQASVSQQLARLRFDRLVTSRREGRSIYYQIANTDVNTIIGSLYDIYCKPAKKRAKQGHSSATKI